jgi:hypothetical protein
MQLATVGAAPVPANTLPRVRMASMDDLDEIMQMGRELHAENGLMSWDEGKVKTAAVNALRGVDGVVGVIGSDPIQAMIYLCLRQYWYAQDGDAHLEEFLAFVRPEFRKSNNAKALIEFAKSSARRLGVPLLIGIVSNEKTAQKIRLYRRRLGEPSGAYFIYGSKTGQKD